MSDHVHVLAHSQRHSECEEQRASQSENSRQQEQDHLSACLVVSVAGVVIRVLIPAVQVHARGDLHHVVWVHVSNPACARAALLKSLCDPPNLIMGLHSLPGMPILPTTAPSASKES